MIRPHEIAFDVDGVVANTMELFLEVARREYGINHIQYSDITEYYLEKCLDIPAEVIDNIIHRLLEGDFNNHLKPLEGSLGVLNAIAQESPLLFVTARPSVSPIREWIHSMLPKTPHPIHVIATGALEAKAAVLQEKGVQFFVEDCLEICFTLFSQGITPIVFCQPWNRSPHPFEEVRHWDGIRALIDLDISQ
jgi:uncharacterized HAD superfamily protein